jgi:VWFA-related protein
MSIATRVSSLIFASLLLPTLTAQQNTAQRDVTPAQQIVPANGPDARRIHLDVVVTNKAGKPVPGLQQQDFTLLDSKTARPLTSFRAVTGNEPVSVVLLVDAVNSTYQQVTYARQQIDRFLLANDGKLAHRTKLAFFTDTGTQIQQGYTTDGHALSEALNQYTVGLRSITRATGFYGASDRYQLSLTTLQQLAQAEGRGPGRKIFLWISPGWPILSGPHIYLDGKQEQQLFGSIVGLSTMLRQSHITLYGVDPLGAAQSVGSTYYYQVFLKGVSKPGQVSAGNLSLQVLAIQSGGLAQSSSNDVAALLQQCMDDMDAYYEISFDPPPAEHVDEYHPLEIRVAQPGLTARTRTGYYAQP